MEWMRWGERMSEIGVVWLEDFKIYFVKKIILLFAWLEFLDLNLCRAVKAMQRDVMWCCTQYTIQFIFGSVGVDCIISDEGLISDLWAFMKSSVLFIDFDESKIKEPKSL